VPLPFYYRHGHRRGPLLTAFEIVIGCLLAILLVLYVTYLFFFAAAVSLERAELSQVSAAVSGVEVLATAEACS
jgi:hypothetical protein